MEEVRQTVGVSHLNGGKDFVVRKGGGTVVLDKKQAEYIFGMLACLLGYECKKREKEDVKPKA